MEVVNYGREVRGIILSGGWSTIKNEKRDKKGEAKGIMISGLANHVENAKGIVASGIYGSFRSITGATISGIWNQSTDKANGLIIAGIGNELGGIKGILVGPICNVTAATKGAIVGSVNVVKETLVGTLMGLVNVVGGESATGFLAGLVNVVRKKSRGVLVGLVNYVGEESKGICLGLLNIVKDPETGEHDISPIIHVNLGIKDWLMGFFKRREKKLLQFIDGEECKGTKELIESNKRILQQMYREEQKALPEHTERHPTEAHPFRENGKEVEEGIDVDSDEIQAFAKQIFTKKEVKKFGETLRESEDEEKMKACAKQLAMIVADAETYETKIRALALSELLKTYEVEEKVRSYDEHSKNYAMEALLKLGLLTEHSSF